MVFSRRHRKLSALLGIAVLFMAQLAIAAHACAPMTQMPDTMASMDAQPTEMPCSDMPEPQDADRTVCAKHCQNESQSSDVPQVAVPAVPAAVAYHVTFAAETGVPEQTFSRRLLARVTAPPAMVRNCCLRT